MDSSATRFAERAASHESHNRLSRAQHFAELSLLMQPDHPLAGLVAARCARRAGHLEQALNLLAGVPEEAMISDHLFEHARILDKLGHHEAAIHTYAQANTVRTSEFPAVDRTLLLRFIEQLSSCFSASWVQQWTPLPPSSRPAPLFMVGFNRSGTTLLDRMLDAHPVIHVLEETAAIDQAQRALGHVYPHGLATLSQGDLQRARQAYFEVIDAHRPDGFTGLVVDKLPMSTIALGLIHRLFPSAKVVFSLRHPMDVVLSNFMQRYAPNPITCHFDSLGNAANIYAKVMALGLQLREVLPISVLDVRYEDLVTDWNKEVRRVLSFAGLPWDPQVQTYLQRTQQQGAIHTPSYDQVVEPVNRKAIGRWTKYSAEMARVFPTLAPFIEAFGYGAPAQGITD